MFTYYAVTMTCDNHGNVTAAITDTRQADTCPPNTFTSTPTRDIYIDWFADRQAAEQFVKAAKRS